MAIDIHRHCCHWLRTTLPPWIIVANRLVVLVS
jgi:hypothetical protein